MRPELGLGHGETLVHRRLLVCNGAGEEDGAVGSVLEASLALRRGWGLVSADGNHGGVLGQVFVRTPAMAGALRVLGGVKAERGVAKHARSRRVRVRGHATAAQLVCRPHATGAGPRVLRGRVVDESA